jgi:hypothetical protein
MRQVPKEPQANCVFATMMTIRVRLSDCVPPRALALMITG